MRMLERARVRGSMAAVLVALVTIAGAGPATGRALRLGQPAPDVAGAPWIYGGPLTLPALRGRVVLVEFWTYG